MVKHADRAETTITLGYGAEALELTIADAGGGVPAGTPGHGLVGMRERAELFGGTLTAGRLATAASRSAPCSRTRRGMSRLRVVIADDQPLMRAGFKTVLEATGTIEVVGEAGDGEEAIRAADACAPDVVLMDIQMPRLDGIEATRRLPRRRVLILTTFGLDEYIVDALRAGASGFLLKDARPQELVGAVRAVAAGDAVLSAPVTRRLLDQIAHRLPAAVPTADFDGLTEREHEVLRLLAGGLSNAEIATALAVSEATVKTHVSNLLGKLGLRDRVQAVILAYETGLVTVRER